MIKNTSFIFISTEKGLELQETESHNTKPLFIDYFKGSAGFRYQKGRAHHETIVKACRIKQRTSLTILDATAGLGHDAYALASCGHQVIALERSPIIVKLLSDAVSRAQQINSSLKITVHHVDAHDYLQQLTPDDFPDVIYLDPMYPARSKKALVKKEMRILRSIIGDDLDADNLLQAALSRAKFRVVVKRPRLAPPLANISPAFSYKGKSSRFDVYISKSN